MSTSLLEKDSPYAGAIVEATIAVSAEYTDLLVAFGDRAIPINTKIDDKVVAMLVLQAMHAMHGDPADLEDAALLGIRFGFAYGYLLHEREHAQKDTATPSFMNARAAALVSKGGYIVEMWREKPESDHERTRNSYDTNFPASAPHQWVEMAPTGKVL